MSKVILKELPKSGNLETVNLYVMGAVVYYPVVHSPKPKYQSTDKEFSVTLFVDEAAKDELLDIVMVNKSILQVGKDKTSRPPRKFKYPLSSQVEEGKAHYDIVDGLFGFSVARPEFSKAGKPMTVNVIDKDGKPFTENVGNGSICNVKMFGYRNVDGQVVVMLDTLQVIEHVPYEAKGGVSGSVDDDVLGVSYQVQTSEVVNKQEQVDTPPVEKESKKEPSYDSFDEDIPFGYIGLQEGRNFLHMI